MRKLEVYIEEDGDFVLAGQIQGETWEDARFIYEKSYLENQSHQPVSISLPFQEDAFSPFETRLLPEGYTRRCVAGWMHVAEEDYLSVLAGLGNECLGAVRICEPGAGGCSPSYKKISREELLEFAKEGASKSAQFLAKAHLSLTGASGKTGLYYDNKDGWYMPFGTAPSTHIVKQSHVRLSGIVANEQLCLRTAKILGIDVPESFIISVGTGEHILFATKRFDRLMQEDSRVIDGKKVPFRLQQEDFAQALGVPASQKYEKIGDSYLKRVFTLLRQYSDNPVEDQLKLWDICIFNYLIGNTDNHIKNIGLLYGKDRRTIRLAPAYDIVSTMIYEESTEQMAMAIDGELDIRKITKESFRAEARHIGLGERIAMRRFEQMQNSFERALAQAKEEIQDAGYPGVEEIYEKILRKNQPNHHLNRQ
mgnify:FL=1